MDVAAEALLLGEVRQIAHGARQNLLFRSCQPDVDTKLPQRLGQTSQASPELLQCLLIGDVLKRRKVDGQRLQLF